MAKVNSKKNIPWC